VVGAEGAGLVHLALEVGIATGIADHGVDLGAEWEAERAVNGRRLALNANPAGLPKRLWAFLLCKAEVDAERPWGELPKKHLNRLSDVLPNDRYAVEGKTTFKEEFVTAGGVALEEVVPLTLGSKRVPGLYFAGEVLDIDGITGGFNFQAAWTTGHIAGRLG
jgi:predicted Rossmann fold flavoprotein